MDLIALSHTPEGVFANFGFMNTSAISKFSGVGFLREAAAELKKVTWPTREETVKLTVIVLLLSVLVGAFIGGLDMIFLSITTKLF